MLFIIVVFALYFVLPPGFITVPALLVNVFPSNKVLFAEIVALFPQELIPIQLLKKIMFLMCY
jgi:hypothetical protein